MSSGTTRTYGNSSFGQNVRIGDAVIKQTHSGQETPPKNKNNNFHDEKSPFFHRCRRNFELPRPQRSISECLSTL